MDQDQGPIGQTPKEKTTQSGKEPGWKASSSSSMTETVDELWPALVDWCGCAPPGAFRAGRVIFGKESEFEYHLYDDEKSVTILHKTAKKRITFKLPDATTFGIPEDFEIQKPKFEPSDDERTDIENRLNSMGIQYRKNLDNGREEIKFPYENDFEPLKKGALNAAYQDIKDLKPFKGTAKPLRKKPFEDAFSGMLHRKQFSPFLDYLENLKWDGVERAKKFLQEVFDIKDERHQKLSEWAILGALTALFQRAYWKKGAKFDFIIILKGPGKCGKSTFFELFCPNPDWFTNSINFKSSQKDMIHAMLGKRFVVFDELPGMDNPQRLDQIKNFASSIKETDRLSYERSSDDYYRRCVIFGTTNKPFPVPNDLHTENRRFLIIEVSRKKLEGGYPAWKKKIKNERDQIFAEVFEKFKEKRKKSFSDLSPELEKIAAEVAEENRDGEHLLEDAFYDAMEGKLVPHAHGGKIGAYFDMKEVLDCLKGDSYTDSDGKLVKIPGVIGDNLSVEKGRIVKYCVALAFKKGFKRQKITLKEGKRLWKYWKED